MGTKQPISTTSQSTCTTVVGGQKVPYQAQRDGFAASITFLGLVTSRIFPVSTIKNRYERTIRERRESHCKSDESTDRGTEKRFPEVLPNAS
jgi:hypothetical protein